MFVVFWMLCTWVLLNLQLSYTSLFFHVATIIMLSYRVMCVMPCAMPPYFLAFLLAYFCLAVATIVLNMAL